MSKAPAFFVPASTPETQESLYASFAKSCKREVPAPGERIFSIAFSQYGENWEATVGQPLQGSKNVTRRRILGRKVVRRSWLSDPAVVLAIFPGIPLLVMTNQGLAGNVGSSWANPFPVGAPQSITYFAN